MRNCSEKEGFDGKQYMRIAVRDHKDNNKLIEALQNATFYKGDSKYLKLASQNKKSYVQFGHYSE